MMTLSALGWMASLWVGASSREDGLSARESNADPQRWQELASSAEVTRYEEGDRKRRRAAEAEALDEGRTTRHRTVRSGEVAVASSRGATAPPQLNARDSTIPRTRHVGEASNGTAPPSEDEPPPPDDPELATDAGVGGPVQEFHIARAPQGQSTSLAERFAEQPVNEATTDAMNAYLAQAFDDLEVKGGLQDTDCRGSVCRVRLRFADMDEAARFREEAAREQKGEIKLRMVDGVVEVEALVDAADGPAKSAQR